MIRLNSGLILKLRPNACRHLKKIPQIRSQTGVRSKNGVRSILSSHPLTDYWLYDHLFTQSNYKHAAPTIVYSVIL